jgi:hypothetical protein
MLIHALRRDRVQALALCLQIGQSRVAFETCKCRKRKAAQQKPSDPFGHGVGQKISD